MPATSQEVDGGDTLVTAIAPVIVPSLMQATWPSETDLILSPHTNRIGLTMQSSLLRDIIHRTFDKIWAALLFSNSFPDAHETLTLISGLLVSAAAESPKSGSVDVHERLLSDAEFMAQMHVLVSPLTHAEYSFTNNIVASCSHSSLPGLGKRSLQCHYIFCIFDH
jgi:hypothetical protein